MSAPIVYLSHDPGLDWLDALPFEATSEGQPAERWRALNGEFAFYRDLETGATVGFGVRSFSQFDVEGEAVAEIWTGPLFTAPVLGLTDAPAGAIVLAAREYFGGRPSINRFWFGQAVNAQGEDALALWRNCLQSGDSMAHFALGYTLYELKHFHEAYRHLRYYTELAPAHPWNWCWFGKAAEALGETEEARKAYGRAIELTEQGADETDADELLTRLSG